MVHSESIVAPVHPHLKCAVQSIKPGRVCSRLPVAALLQEAATSEGPFLKPCSEVSLCNNPTKHFQDDWWLTMRAGRTLERRVGPR